MGLKASSNNQPFIDSNSQANFNCNEENKANTKVVNCQGPSCPANHMLNSDQNNVKDKPFHLDTNREISSIPKFGPQSDFWQYPSEQMFFNAMLRKGWHWTEDNLQSGDMKHIVNIHNRNNENVWKEILKWESLHFSKCCNPKLVSFHGCANNYSPRARFRSWLGYELPFDRHDWIISRKDKRIRYIIDYYGCESIENQELPLIFVDVRPALDSIGAIWDRARVAAWRWAS